MKKNALFIIAFLLIVGFSIFGYLKFFNNKLSQKEINNIIDGYDYSYILGKGSLNANQISKENVLKLIYTSGHDYLDKDADKYFSTTDNCYKDSYDKIENEIDQTKYVLNGLGFSETELKKINIKNYKYVCLQEGSPELITTKKLNQIIKDKFGISNYIDNNYIIKNDFVKTDCNGYNLKADPNTDKIVSYSNGGCTIYDDYSVIANLDGYKKNNQYIINIVEGTFIGYQEGENEYLSLVAKTNLKNKIIDKVADEKLHNKDGYEESLIKKYQDKLDKYNLIFEKNGNIYQLIKVEYLNN